MLCTSSDSPAETLAELSTRLDTHDALDLLDMQEVADSWRHAQLLNQTDG